MSLAISVEVKRIRLRRQVCKIEYNDGHNQVSGSGFLIGPKWVITNYHVVEAAIKDAKLWSNVTVYFDWDGNSPGNPTDLDPNEPLLWESPYHYLDLRASGWDKDWPDDCLDAAILQLADEVGNHVIRADCEQRRGWLSLSSSGELVSKGGLHIFQHPHGQPLAAAEGNLLLEAWNKNKTRVRYTTATAKGSSGSPGLNSNMQLLALHHAGEPDNPLKCPPEYNQGVPTGTICAYLRKNPKLQKIADQEEDGYIPVTTDQAVLYNTFRMILQGQFNEQLEAQLPAELRGRFNRAAYEKAPDLAIIEIVIRAQKRGLADALYKILDDFQRANLGMAAVAKPKNCEVLLGGADALVDRKDLIASAQRLLNRSDTTVITVEGQPRTGKSFVYKYFRHLCAQNPNFDLHNINARKLATNEDPVVDAYRLAEQLNAILKIQFPFFEREEDRKAFKIEPFVHHLRSRLAAAQRKTVLFIEGIDLASPMNDFYTLISRLVELADNGLEEIRLVAVGLDETKANVSQFLAAQKIVTRDFTEDDVLKFFVEIDAYLRPPNLKSRYADDFLKQKVGKICYEADFNNSPNVERIGKLCQGLCGILLST